MAFWKIDKEIWNLKRNSQVSFKGTKRAFGTCNKTIGMIESKQRNLSAVTIDDPADKVILHENIKLKNTVKKLQNTFLKGKSKTRIRNVSVTSHKVSRKASTRDVSSNTTDNFCTEEEIQELKRKIDKLKKSIEQAAYRPDTRTTASVTDPVHQNINQLERKSTEDIGTQVVIMNNKLLETSGFVDAQIQEEVQALDMNTLRSLYEQTLLKNQVLETRIESLSSIIASMQKEKNYQSDKEQLNQIYGSGVLNESCIQHYLSIKQLRNECLQLKSEIAGFKTNKNTMRREEMMCTRTSVSLTDEEVQESFKNPVLNHKLYIENKQLQQKIEQLTKCLKNADRKVAVLSTGNYNTDTVGSRTYTRKQSEEQDFSSLKKLHEEISDLKERVHYLTKEIGEASPLNVANTQLKTETKTASCNTEVTAEVNTELMRNLNVDCRNLKSKIDKLLVNLDRIFGISQCSGNSGDNRVHHTPSQQSQQCEGNNHLTQPNPEVDHTEAEKQRIMKELRNQYRDALNQYKDFFRSYYTMNHTKRKK